jgi:hypothetical protein
MDTEIGLCQSLTVGNVAAEITTNRKREKDRPDKLEQTDRWGYALRN